MSAAFNSGSAPWLQWLRRHRAWVLVGLTILLVVVVRVRVRNLPLERDEGEYAYAGQLILQGAPPYLDTYTMKLPGTYAAYALIMAVFGQSPAAIHLGLAIVNVASILLMFLLGRRLLGEASGVAAAVAFALLSLSPSVLGLSGHATHFVVLAALGGILLLLRACEEGVQSQGMGGMGGMGPNEAPRTTHHAPRPTPHAPRFTFHVSRLTHHVFPAALLFGLAFLMKQHGLFFGVFGAVYLVRVRVGEWLAASGVKTQQPGFRSLRERTGFNFAHPAARAARARLIRDTLWFGLGWLLPYAVTCLVLAGAGAFHQFVFWTITYAAQYASAIPIVKGPDVLRASLNAVVGPNLLLWVLPWVGALVMWWEDRLDEGSLKSKVQSLKSNVQSQEMGGGMGDRGLNDAPPDTQHATRNTDHAPRTTQHATRTTQHATRIPHARFFLVTLLFCSIASASIGLYFREHYFILVLPVLALLTGVAVSRGFYLLRHDQTIELFLAVPILGLFGIAICSALIGHGAVWFALPADQAMRSVFGSNLFAETARAADYLKAHAAATDRIAVLGSEPEIYFLSHRRAATGYIYTYPLMEERPFALKMQEQMIAEIERARPTYIVYVDDPYSWLTRPDSAQRLFEWWRGYWASDLDLVQTLQVEEGLARGSDMAGPGREQAGSNHILILKRRGG